MGSYGHMLCRNTYSAGIHPSGRGGTHSVAERGDLPRGLRLRLRMTLCHIQRETTSGKAGTLSAEFCRHVVQIVIDVLFHGERFGYIEVDRLLTVASDNAVGFTFH